MHRDASRGIGAVAWVWVYVWECVLVQVMSSADAMEADESERVVR